MPTIRMVIYLDPRDHRNLERVAAAHGLTVGNMAKMFIVRSLNALLAAPPSNGEERRTG